MVETALTAAHRRRLREVWRSAGWPCRDNIELDLLAGGLLQADCDAHGRETLHVTAAGLHLMAATRLCNQAARSDHDALVGRVGLAMQQAGRVVWRGLRLRAPLPVAAPDDTPSSTRWAVAMPDVFSIRHTTLEDQVEPIAHEIKVSRADLLSDLRRPDKGAAYAALASQCWYVLRRGIAQADELPPAYGVMLADDSGLEVLRPAPRRAMRLSFAVWMALARATPDAALDTDAQGLLGDRGPSSCAH